MKRKPQVCSKCGQIRKGHTCTYAKVIASDSEDDDIEISLLNQFSGPHKNHFISTYANVTPHKFDNLKDALVACLSHSLGGVTSEQRLGKIVYTLRTAQTLQPSPTNECSWVNVNITTGVMGVNTTSLPDWKWQFEDGQTWENQQYKKTDQWVNCDDSLNTKLTKAYFDDVNKPFTCDVLGATYIFDFKELLQVRQSYSSKSGVYGYQRRIRNQNIPESTKPIVALHQPVVTTNAGSTSAANPIPSSSIPPSPPQYDFANQATALSRFPWRPLLLPSGSENNYPTYWGPDRTEQALPSTSEEFKQLGYMFTTDLFSGSMTNHNWNLHSISCISNHMRFNMFQMKAEEMRQRGVNPREMYLWHGLPGSKLTSLLRNGFLRDYGKRQAFGDGTYFATNASYSWNDGFSVPEKNGKNMEKVLLLARVLVGDSCQGNQGMSVPDTKKDGHICDSMVDNMRSPTMYILSAGSDANSYIEFVFRFVDG